MKYVDFTSWFDAAPADVALLSTFTFDPIFFEKHLLKCAALVQARRIMILMDAGGWRSLCNTPQQPRWLNSRYLVVPIPRRQGVFHAKLQVLLSPKRASVFCGSGNLTRPGCMSNLELVNCIPFEPSTNAADDVESLAIVSRAITFFRMLVDAAGSAAGKLAQSWLDALALEYPQLVLGSPATQLGPDGVDLVHTAGGDIWGHLNAIWTRDGLKRIEVVSPFFDPDLGLLKRKSVFATADRVRPLILPTHLHCNGAQSGYDEIVGQVIAAIHGKYPEPARMRLDVQVAEDTSTGAQSAWLSGTNLHRTICRWLRAFHAALYREYLPDNDGTKDGTRLGFDPPFPIGHVDAGGEIMVDEIRPHHVYFVEQIKRNRTAGRLDRIVCFNGKCVYECVWAKADDGQPICIFALNVYDWSALANTDDFQERGCVGVYLPAGGKPASATTGTALVMPISNIEKLDPFGQ